MTTTRERYAIPALCCAPGNHARNHDLNSDWTCKRAAHIRSAQMWADEIDRERERAGRLRGRDAARRSANLLKWADDQEAHLSRLGAWWMQHPCAGVGYTPVEYCGGLVI